MIAGHPPALKIPALMRQSLGEKSNFVKLVNHVERGLVVKAFDDYWLSLDQRI